MNSDFLTGLLLALVLVFSLFLTMSILDRDYDSGSMVIPAVNPSGMAYMNIYCSSSHNHPLFQNYTLCAFSPRLREVLGYD